MESGLPEGPWKLEFGGKSPPSFSISLIFKTWRPLLEVNKKKRLEKEFFILFIIIILDFFLFLFTYESMM